VVRARPGPRRKGRHLPAPINEYRHAIVNRHPTGQGAGCDGLGKGGLALRFAVVVWAATAVHQTDAGHGLQALAT
jgi:hypothetical protein